MKQDLMKTQTGWVPVDESAKEFHSKTKAGATVHGDFTQIRNAAFHRKYFALLNIGFDNWVPVFDNASFEERWGIPEKNFETFRKNIAILCGFCDPVFNLNNTYKLEARSISFAGMKEKQFQELYSKTIDVLLKNVYGAEDMTAEKLDDIVQSYLSFA